MTRPDLSLGVVVLHGPGRGDTLPLLLHRAAPEPLLGSYEAGVEDVSQSCELFHSRIYLSVNRVILISYSID